MSGQKAERLDERALSEERRLVEGAQKEPRRFAVLYERYFERIYAFVLSRVANRTVAEDVTAETFRLAYQNLGRFEWRGVPFSAWLFRIAANLIKRGQRQAGRFDALDEFDPPDEDAADIDAGIRESEQKAELWALVSRLPADQRRVITMRFAEEKSIAEIAAATGRSEGAVKQLQFRAVQRLRDWARVEA